MEIEKGEKMVTLVSSDGEEFKVEERVAKQWTMLKMIMENGVSMDKPTKINVAGDVLGALLEYCERHAKGGEEEEMKKFDDKFMRRTSLDLLYGLTTASNYLEIDGLLELTTQTIADLVKGKNPDQIRRIFNIKNDFSPEEYAKIATDYSWAFRKF